MSDLAARLGRYHERIERVLAAHLSAPEGKPETRSLDDGRSRLLEAMRYSALGGGKRLRPMLVYVTGESLGAPLDRLDAAAAAVELIHVYSLVHDDLPSMDNDDLRRGRPTCHRAFDEATAMLAGDALQALAFGVIALEQSGLAPKAQLSMLRILADAAGTDGMAGGQAIDLASVGHALTPGAVENMHQRKTGALIKGSVLIGATAAGFGEGLEYQALDQYGAHIGLAFQIQDDILDVEGDPDMLGKSTGADAARNKPTYPSSAGLDAARKRALELRDTAVAALAPLGRRGDALAELAAYMVSRSN